MPVNQACASSGVKKKDFEWVLKYHDGWREQIESAKAKAVQFHIARLAQAGGRQRRVRTLMNADGEVTLTITDDVQGDWKADAWMLEKLDPENFGDKQLTISGNVDISVLLKSVVESVASRGATMDIAQDAEFQEIEESAKETQ